jgi:hypothetical protein
MINAVSLHFTYYNFLHILQSLTDLYTNLVLLYFPKPSKDWAANLLQVVKTQRRCLVKSVVGL